MKIDRRDFLSFVAGGAAGTALSPLPWKLMDDFSIWSQVWPWVPVPKGGEVAYADTICSLCPGACGITVRKIENRAVKIDGLKGHPINDGSVCALGLSGLQLLYGPTRVKSPMKRIGNRGSNRWEKISWNEAIAIVARELGSIRTEGYANKLACISGYSEGTVSLLMQRFFHSYGSSNFIKIPSGQDINKLVFNIFCDKNVVLDFDFENSDFILSLGSGLVDGWTSPTRMIRINSNWRDNKVRVVQVEGTLSNTAAKATQWVPINPGTESDLAFGIAAFMLSNNLYDIEFVSKSFIGFEKWEKVLISDYSLMSVSRTTGISVSVITDLAKSFATAKRPIALSGRGKGAVPSSFRDYISSHLLNILKGNINKKGGVWVCKDFDYIDWPSICIDEIASKGIDCGQIIETGSFKGHHYNHLQSNLISNLKAKKCSLQALFIIGANPCYSLPDTLSVKEAFRQIPFVVTFSSFMDETSAEADLILPDNVYLEKFEDVSVLTGLGRQLVGLSRPVVSAQFNTRHIGETIINIAHKLGGTMADSFPWTSYEECIEKGLKGIDFIQSNAKGLWFNKTLEPIELDKFNFTEVEFPTIQVDGNISLYPFVLVPCDSLRLSSGHIASSPFMVKTVSDTVIKGNMGFVDINPETAKFVGLDDGDYAILSTPKGEAKVKINFYDGVKPGVLTMFRGLGHTAYDSYIANKGVNINDLIDSFEDPVLGHDTFWGIRARLAKA